MDSFDEVRIAAERAKQGLGTIRAPLGGATQPSLKDRVMKAFRAGHAQCGVWRWLPEKGTFAPIEVDTRCSLCKEIDGSLLGG